MYWYPLLVYLYLYIYIHTQTLICMPLSRYLHHPYIHTFQIAYSSALWVRINRMKRLNKLGIDIYKRCKSKQANTTHIHMNTSANNTHIRSHHVSLYSKFQFDLSEMSKLFGYSLSITFRFQCEFCLFEVCKMQKCRTVCILQQPHQHQWQQIHINKITNDKHSARFEFDWNWLNLDVH